MLEERQSRLKLGPGRRNGYRPQIPHPRVAAAGDRRFDTRLSGRLLGAAALLAFVACSATQTRPGPNAHLLAGVPFFSQSARQCGPAALAALVSFLGPPTSPDQIAAEIYQPDSGGTSSVAMLAYGARHQLPLQVIRGQLDDVYAEIDGGRPLIVLHRAGFPFRDYHYVVVTGYDPAAGRLYGYSGRDAQASWTEADFSRRWARADHWTLTWSGRSQITRGAPDHRTSEQDQANPRKGE